MMKAANTIQSVNLLQAPPSRENAEEIVKILSDNTETEEKYITKDEFYKEMLSVRDKIDSSAKWTVGFIAALLSLAVAILKLT